MWSLCKFNARDLIWIDTNILGSVNCFRILSHVFTNLIHNLDTSFRNSSVCHWSYVQQVISASADDLEKKVQDIIRILPVCIVFIITPCIIYSCRYFPVTVVWKTWDEVITGGHVIALLVSDTSADDAVRLNTLNPVS